MGEFGRAIKRAHLAGGRKKELRLAAQRLQHRRASFVGRIRQRDLDEAFGVPQGNGLRGPRHVLGQQRRHAAVEVCLSQVGQRQAQLLREGGSECCVAHQPPTEKQLA